MLTQLPYETVDHIIGYLDFKDVRSIARVSSAFLVPAQRRLFRSIRLGQTSSGAFQDHIKSILSSPHLLQYSSHLVFDCCSDMQVTTLHSSLSHLPIMHRFRNVDIHLNPICLKMLFAPEFLSMAREITLSFRFPLPPDLLISDDLLPVHTLQLFVEASNHEVETRFIRKCSQSLRKLHLVIVDIPPSLPFLPHLYEFSFWNVNHKVDDPDFASLFPFFYQHPTITRMILVSEVTLAVQPPPDLLPNLQFLRATPAIIERLVPGRPVNEIHAEYTSHARYHFPVDAMLRALRQPSAPVTSLTIKTDSYLSNDLFTNLVQALPKLREAALELACFTIFPTFQGLLTALGRCTDMVHIRLHISIIGCSRDFVRPLWSRGNFVQMVQWVQENGAAGLWSFELHALLLGYPEGCEAMRIGWLDTPRQPTLRGEWRFDVWGSPSDSDMPISA